MMPAISRSLLAISLLWSATAGALSAQRPTDEIRLNQLGFYPGAPKIAAVLGADGSPFYVTTPDLADTVFTGRLSERLASDLWSDTTRIADFSALERPGTYVVHVPGLGYSYPFEVRPHVHAELARAAAAAFYVQRASVPILSAYAGAWGRPAGHPDDRVLVHPSAASRQRPAGTVLSSPGGWYDAGDYNKYVVNSGISVATLLSLYEDFPWHAGTLDLPIPETGDAVPDLLDEALWNIRWMLTMQDPHDGGVYHKLTEASFEGFVAPATASSTRYVVQKSTAAALNLAAVSAQASRILRRYEHALPGLADSLLTASVRAWQWARRNPDAVYDQNALNQQHDPDVTTGAYGDRDLRDEFSWAAVELYLTTRQDSFYTAVPIYPDSALPVASWSQVRALGFYSLARFRADLPPGAAADRPRLQQVVVDLADRLVSGTAERPYRVVMGGGERDFVWGSNAVAANQGIALVQAYRLTGDARYLRHALSNLDYLLGRNATGYSFVTGFGHLTPLRPHHRLAATSGLPVPMPGLLVGGPNPGRQDECEYPSTLREKAYVDDVCSYASNEIAINWNSPFVYLANALEAMQFEIGRPR